MNSDCFALIPFVALLLFIPSLAQAQDFSYASDCESNVDNQTIILEQDLNPALGNGVQAATGDTVAVYTENGTCAGYVVWTDDSDVSLAAAEDVMFTDPIDGYVQGEMLKFEIYDVSEATAIKLGMNISFADCASDASPLCSDDGAYATNTISYVDAFAEGPLPVELAAFEAQRTDSRVLLTWATVSEENNAGFNVQLRRNGSTSWETLSFVEGAGTTTDQQSYRFETDDLSFGQYAFRLQQVDQDGSTSLSNVVEVEINLDRAYVVSGIYPNPVRSRARIDIAVQKGQIVQVALYDLLGRRVETLYDQTLPANQTESLQIGGRGLSSGAYFLRIQGESFVETRRLTIVQ
jgi:hypothetical protein